MAKKTKLRTNDYDPNDVSCPVPDYLDYMALLDLPHTLRGGTPAMRDAGEKYLPRNDKEKEKDYKARLHRSFLLNAFDETIEDLSGEVFSKPIEMDENMLEQIQFWCGDIDLSGHNITRFGRTLFETGITDGVVHFLVDMPQIQTRQEENGSIFYLDSNDGEWKLLTVQAMIDNEWRPYFVIIKAEQLIGWRHEQIEGNQVLTQIRILEVTEEPLGAYGVQEVCRIRVIERDRFVVYRYYDKDEEGKEIEGEWRIEIDESGNEVRGETGRDYIPLVTYLIGEPISQMTAKPPLDDLAWLNLSHWQSSSDQKNILHYARMVIFFAKMLDLGVDEQGKQEEVALGSNVLVHSNQPEADMKVVEPTGAAIESGRNDLLDIENQMKKYTISMLAGQRPGSVTATEKAIDTAQQDNSLRSWALDLQAVLNHGLKIAVDMMGLKETDMGDGVKVNDDFKSFLRSMEVKELREAYIDGIIPKQLVFEEYKRRGIIKTEMDFEDLMLMMRNEERNVE